MVNEQVHVQFQIGEYKDKIVCDVAEMDACHLLSGKPWQFDVNSIKKMQLVGIRQDSITYIDIPLPVPKWELRRSLGCYFFILEKDDTSQVNNVIVL